MPTAYSLCVITRRHHRLRIYVVYLDPTGQCARSTDQPVQLPHGVWLRRADLHSQGQAAGALAAGGVGDGSHSQFETGGGSVDVP